LDQEQLRSDSAPLPEDQDKRVAEKWEQMAESTDWGPLRQRGQAERATHQTGTLESTQC
jgi:hypothetical protein